LETHRIMNFTSSYAIGQLTTFIYGTIVSGYSQGVNTIYNITAKDPTGADYVGTMQRGIFGEFIIMTLTAV
jgi:RPA family protein